MYYMKTTDPTKIFANLLIKCLVTFRTKHGLMFKLNMLLSVSEGVIISEK